MKRSPIQPSFFNAGNYTAKLLVITSLAAIWSSSVIAQPPTESQRILECVADNLPPAVRVVDASIETHGERADSPAQTIRLRFAAEQRGNSLQAVAIVREPHDLKGSAYLFRQSGSDAEMYYYNPELDRVRRISGASASAPLFDTAISFQDFRTVEDALRTSSISLRSRRDDDPEHQRRFIVMPPPDSALPVSRINMDVHTEYCVIVHAELLDKERRLVRRMRIDVDDLDTLPGGYHYPRRIRIDNPELERSSRITVHQVEVPGTLPADTFHPERFHRQ